ncbi:MAG: SDR family oxidoreductase [Desulfobacterales bacterium]|nr:SDR family oxidoreductase [Desulfobacterales bacterium]
MRLLVLGANSDIAHALARLFARRERAELVLASRDMQRLEKRARDVSVRTGVRAEAVFFDACDFDSHEGFYAAIDPKPDGVVLAFGEFADQAAAQKDFRLAHRIIESNFTAAAGILSVIASDFEVRGHGFIVGIGSVAGLRGRQSNYIYGAAKAGLNVFLAGLRHRLFRRGVQVTTVLPGFVRTKMTENLDLPQRLVVEPEAAAEAIYRGWKKKRPVVYAPGFWRWIMLIIRFMPEAVFNRTRL